MILEQIWVYSKQQQLESLAHFRNLCSASCACIVRKKWDHKKENLMSNGALFVQVSNQGKIPCTADGVKWYKCLGLYNYAVIPLCIQSYLSAHIRRTTLFRWPLEHREETPIHAASPIRTCRVLTDMKNLIHTYIHTFIHKQTELGTYIRQVHSEMKSSSWMCCICWPDSRRTEWLD